MQDIMVDCIVYATVRGDVGEMVMVAAIFLSICRYISQSILRFVCFNQTNTQTSTLLMYNEWRV